MTSYRKGFSFSHGMDFFVFLQQRELIVFSAQISSGVCGCRFWRNVPRGSGGFRCVLVFRKVSEVSGDKFRKVPECWCSSSCLYVLV